MGIRKRECKAAGIDPGEVARIAKGLSKYGKQAAALDIRIFGGAGDGSLRFDDGQGRPLIIYDGLTGHFDGGDGACWEDGEGHLRGE